MNYPEIRIARQDMGDTTRIVWIEIEGVRVDLPADTDITMSGGPGPLTLTFQIIPGKVEFCWADEP